MTASTVPLAVPASSPSSTRSRSRESTHSSFATSSDPSAETPLQQESSIYRADLPAFLRQTRAEIHAKYIDLEWQQRHRLAQGRLTAEAVSEWARLTGEEVLKRNRYLNVEPFMNNRIRLKVPEGQSDYINASPIMLKTTISGSVMSYIATQGPKEGIHSHIWRMVWHETSDPAIIVMLTQTHEAGREKCFQYFPESLDEPVLEIIEEDEFWKGFSATLKLISLTEDFDTRCTIRELELTLKEPTVGPDDADPDANKAVAEADTADAPASDGAEPVPTAPSTASTEAPETTDADPPTRKVLHFLFAAWPDFLIPEGDDRAALLQLIRLLASKTRPAGSSSPPSPPIIHCSAGVGRSGTFIALDFLLAELAEGALDAVPDGEDPIAETVDRLRRQRMMMVQSEAQFGFLYDVLREQWLERTDGKGAPPGSMGGVPDLPNSDVRTASEDDTVPEGTTGGDPRPHDDQSSVATPLAGGGLPILRASLHGDDRLEAGTDPQAATDALGVKRSAEPQASAAKMARLEAELEAEMRQNVELM